MTRDRIIEIAAGVLIAGVAWGLHQTYDLNAKVSALDSNVSAANNRMDRIATAIPSVAERLAQQEVGNPAKTVVVATKPVEAAPNKWESTILVFDVDKRAVTTYSLPLADQYDRAVFARTTGAALAAERHAQSFQDLETNLRNMQDTTRIADVIMANSSFILRDASAADYMATFKAVHGPDNARVRTQSLKRAPVTWQTINGELSRYPGKYQWTNDSAASQNNQDRRY